MSKLRDAMLVLLAFLFSVYYIGNNVIAQTEPVIEPDVETIARQGEKDRLPGSLKFASITLQAAGIDFFIDQPEGLRALSSTKQENVAAQKPAKTEQPKEETTVEQTTGTSGTTTTITIGPGGSSTTVVVNGDDSDDDPDLWYQLGGTN